MTLVELKELKGQLKYPSNKGLSLKYVSIVFFHCFVHKMDGFFIVYIDYWRLDKEFGVTFS